MSKHKLLSILAFSSLVLVNSASANPGNACNTPAAEHGKGLDCSAEPNKVPELDAASTLIAFSLVAGFVTLIRERKKSVNR